MDITNFIEKAVSLDVNWQHFDFHDVSDILSKEYIVDYDIHDGKIAIVYNSEAIVGYLHLKYPFFFITDEHHSQIHSILDEHDYIQYIKVDSIYHEYLSVDPVLYNIYFDYMENMKDFSAEDFYFWNVN